MRIIGLMFILTISTPVTAQEECVGFDNDALRLSCYDRALGRQDAVESMGSDSEEASSGTMTSEISAAFLHALSEKSAVDLIAAVERDDSLGDLQDEMRLKAIDLILSYVRPLPASNAEANRDGYAALAALDPDNSTYAQKANRYASAVEEKRSSIIRRMSKETDEFSGTVFYQHQNTPRYSNTRSYLAVYAGKNGDRVWLRMRLNYTGDSWLFVQNAALNIDGETVQLPYSEWKRDNNSDIWEWIDISVDNYLREILMKIAASKSTIVRFNGSQYYDNVKVREADKQVIRDMFLVEEVLKEQSG